MLIRQPLKIENRDFILTFAISLKNEYSDWTEADVLDKLENGIDIEYAVENHYYIINQVNQKYSEAYDPAEFGRTYTETDIPIEPVEESDEIEQKAAAFDYLTGRSAVNE